MNADDMYNEELVSAEEISADYEAAMVSFHDPIRMYERPNRRNNDIASKFLGDGPRSVEAFSTKTYYGRQMSWIVKHITTLQGWKTVSVHGFMYEKPVYWDVQISDTKKESCVVDGQILVEKDNIRLVVTVVAEGGFLEIEGRDEHSALLKKLVQDIADFLQQHNFYRGK